jgi:hypothetical protein
VVQPQSSTIEVEGSSLDITKVNEEDMWSWGVRVTDISLHRQQRSSSSERSRRRSTYQYDH